MSGFDGRDTWLDRVADLLGGEKTLHRRPIRRLWAEQLERRNVLCSVTGATVVEPALDGPTLTKLHDQAAAMGPIARASTDEQSEIASGDSNAAGGQPTGDPSFADQYFARYAGEGEGEGEGGEGGSGSGGGGSSGSGSGSGECSGSGSGCGEGSGSGSGTGEGSGSGTGEGSGSGSGTAEGSGSGTGEGSGSGSGGGEEETNQPPSISIQWEVIDGMLYLTGTVSDDGDLSELFVNVGDLVNGTVAVDENGHFTLEVACPQNQGMISFSAIDDHGLMSDTDSIFYTP